MPKITLTLVVTFDEIEQIEIEAQNLQTAIQHRLFGEGVFGPETIVDTWWTHTVINARP